MQPLIIYGGSDDLTIKFAQNYIEKNIGKEIFNSTEYFLIKTLKDKKSISIEQIRQLSKNLFTKPSIGNHKVVVISEANLLTVEAQNSMLKILEDAPSYLLIIFCLSHYTQLIETVISRCLLISLDVNTPDLPALYLDWYKSILDLLGGDIGTRVDWVFENKVVLGQKDSVIELMDYWLVEINNQLNNKQSNNQGYKYLSNICSHLLEAKSNLSKNANPLMVIESFLYTIK